MNNNTKKTNKKLQFLIPLIIFLISLSICFYYIYTNYIKVDLSNEVKEIIKNNKQEKVPKDEQEPKQEEYINQLPNYRNQYNNQYIMGKITIPQLKIDSLITRASNNSFYLDHNLYNAYDVLGTPFFDHRNINLISDKQINIYGHNTQNEKYYDQLPFTNLEAYTDIYLDIDEKEIHYKVFSIKIVTNNDNEHMKLIFYSDNDYITHINKLLTNSLYQDSINIEPNDRILVLQACHYNPIGSYLLVIGKEATG